MDVNRRRELEDEFWRTSPEERPESDSLENVVNKAQDAAVLLGLLRLYENVFREARSILEIGAGQGWAACMVKRMFPSAVVTATDLSSAAVASAWKWERVFDVKLDHVRHCPSDDLQEPDSSIDVVFCFAAAHHFVTHRGTLEEIHRVLRPGGHGLYLYEPTCPDYLYDAALRRVERKRPAVPEDVIRHAHLRSLAEAVGLECEVQFYPSVARRGPVETLYYAFLSRLPFLQPHVPCTANFVFRKR